MKQTIKLNDFKVLLQNICPSYEEELKDSEFNWILSNKDEDNTLLEFDDEALKNNIIYKLLTQQE